MDTIRFARIADIPAFSGECSLVTRSVTDAGDLLFLFVETAASEAVLGNDTRATTHDSLARMSAPAQFRLVGVRGDWHYIIDLPPLDLTFPRVDVFPSGRVLVVGARSQWRREDDYDLNGVIYDPADGSTTRILLGDGINSVYVDRRGLIWASYFDEGIFGSLGWKRPVGSTGLACFSKSGEKVWEFPERMAECYALNVSGSQAVAYYYTDFPICRVSDDFRVTYWTTPLRGCRELAVTQSRALLTAQYNDPPGIGYVGWLEGNDFRSVGQVRFLLPDGTQIPTHSFVGRGRHLYYFDAAGAYRATLD